MAGATVRARYVGDDGTNYCVRMPGWEAALQGTAYTACTTEPKFPYGAKGRRHRMLRYNDTLREQQVTVLRAADAVWTAPIGTAVAAPEAPDFGTVPGSANATWQGAIGERRLNR